MGKRKKRAVAKTVVESASLFRRAGAFAIDWYVGALVMALPVSAIAMHLGRDIADQNILFFEEQWGLIAGLLAVLFGVVYYAVVPLITRGQTLGKRICKLRVASKDGSEVSSLALLGRQVLGLMLVEGAAVGTSAVLWRVVCIVTGVDLSTFAMVGGTAAILASIAMAGFSAQHRALHDYAFGTVVLPA